MAWLLATSDDLLPSAWLVSGIDPLTMCDLVRYSEKRTNAGFGYLQASATFLGRITCLGRCAGRSISIAQEQTTGLIGE
jgi:hypothetical protein